MHRQVLEEQNGLEGVCIWTSDESWRVTLHLVSALSSSWEEPVLCAGTVTGSSCLSAFLSFTCGFPSGGLKVTPDITLCSRW